jgi:hypothetical protein
LDDDMKEELDGEVEDVVYEERGDGDGEDVEYEERGDGEDVVYDERGDGEEAWKQEMQMLEELLYLVGDDVYPNPHFVNFSSDSDSTSRV